MSERRSPEQIHELLKPFLATREWIASYDSLPEQQLPPLVYVDELIPYLEWLRTRSCRDTETDHVFADAALLATIGSPSATEAFLKLPQFYS